MKNNSLFLITLLLFINSINAQKEQRQLIDSSYSYLMDSFYDFKDKDSLKASFYADSYYQKAKKEKKIKNLFNGMYFKSLVVKNDSLYLNFIDSIIYDYKKKPNKFLPAIAYQDKFKFFFEKGERYKSLNSLLKAISYSKKVNNDSLMIKFSLRLSILKYEIGDYDEAHQLLSNLKDYYIKNGGNEIEYISVILNLVNVLITKGDFELALKNLDNLQVRLKEKKMIRFGGYIFHKKSLIYFKKGKYNKSIEFGENSLKGLFKDNNYKLILSTFKTIAMSYEKVGNNQKSIEFSKKIDSIQRIYNINSKALSYAYSSLRNHYSKLGNRTKEIYYLEKLIIAEKRLSEINKNFSNKMIRSYDIPKLREEKGKLIKELESDIKISNYYKYTFGTLGLMSFIAFIFYYIRQHEMKKQFQLIYKNQKNKIEKETIQKPDLNLPKQVIDKILTSIETFEFDNRYLDANITLNSLAKEFETNANYLSKIINHYKENNFSKYLSNLRINYILESLKEDEKIRKYTIKAIAEEAGFKNTESFSNAFQLKTGLKPSYYIRQLNKKLN